MDANLQRASITLKSLINIARDADLLDWSLDALWDVRFQDLKDAIRRGELPAARDDNDPRMRFASVRLAELWGFAAGRDDHWEWLREFCRRWAKARGEELTQRAKSNAGRRRTNSAAEIKKMVALIRAAEEAGSTMTVHAAAVQVANDKLGRTATPQEIDTLRKRLTRHYNDQLGQN